MDKVWGGMTAPFLYLRTENQRIEIKENIMGQKREHLYDDTHRHVHPTPTTPDSVRATRDTLQKRTPIRADGIVTNEARSVRQTEQR